MVAAKSKRIGESRAIPSPQEVRSSLVQRKEQEFLQLVEKMRTHLADKLYAAEGGKLCLKETEFVALDLENVQDNAKLKLTERIASILVVELTKKGWAVEVAEGNELSAKVYQIQPAPRS